MGPLLRPVLLDQVTSPNPVPTLGLLKRTDCQVDVAENSHIGVEKFKSVRYDLVRMDFEMAVMDACTAARDISKREAGRVLCFQERSKPEETVWTTVGTGSYVFEPAYLEYIPSGPTR